MDAEPGVGCTVEELRLWLVRKFAHVNRDATELEVRAAARINQVATQVGARVDDASTRVAAMQPIARRSANALNDVGGFGDTKNFATAWHLQRSGYL